MQTRNVSMLDCIERVPSLVKAIFENRENTQKELFCYLGEEGLSRLSGIVFVGSGTSSTSGTTAAYFANKVAGVPVSAVVPSDFCYHTYHYDPDTLYVFISQTGTSQLTKQAMDLVKAKGYHCVCVSESKDTPMAKEAPCFLDMGCGYEEYPMRTIGYSTTVFTLQMLALEIGRRKGAVSDADYAAYCEEAKRLPELLSPVPGMTMEWLQKKSQWQMIRSQCLVFTGSAAQYGVSLESAVKAWETPKMTSVGLELEEGMHGANYGYNSNHCVIVFNDGGIDSKKALSLARYMREVFHNGLAVGAEVVCEDDLKLTLCGENFCCLQFAAVGQTISYKLALDEGRDLLAPHDNSVMNSYFRTHADGKNHAS